MDSATVKKPRAPRRTKAQILADDLAKQNAKQMVAIPEPMPARVPDAEPLPAPAVESVLLELPVLEPVGLPQEVKVDNVSELLAAKEKEEREQYAPVDAPVMPATKFEPLTDYYEEKKELAPRNPGFYSGARPGMVRSRPIPILPKCSGLALGAAFRPAGSGSTKPCHKKIW